MESGLQGKASRPLECALLANFVAHCTMMVGAAFTLPAMPGGGAASDLSRVAWIAENPWLFRLGSAPRHLVATIGVAFAVILLRTRWIPKLPAAAALLFTIAGLIPDQGSLIVWNTRGVELAREAVASGDCSRYLALEGVIFTAAAGWAGLLYTGTGLGWTFSFALSGIWSRALFWLSTIIWTTFGAVSLSPLLPLPWRLPSSVIAAGNGVAFLLLEVWFVVITERVLRRARPVTRAGVHAPFRHPAGGPFGLLAGCIAESRFLRAFSEQLPALAFSSDTTDVIYVNYVVPAERLESWVPDGLELQRLGPEGRHALFTFLTYRHGHFGPSALGPLRRLFPSPIHTDWRIHVVNPVTGHRGIYIITSAITSTLHALGARLFSEGMPLHVLAAAELRRDVGGEVQVRLDPGTGTAPDADLALRPGAPDLLPPSFAECFASYRDLLAYVVPQARTMATHPWRGPLCRHEIDPEVPLEANEPLAGSVRSRTAEAIVGEALPLCFRVPKAALRFDREETDALPQGAAVRGEALLRTPSKRSG